MDKTRKTSKRRPRRSFTPEFKAEAVRLCRIGDRSVAQVAKDLDLTETSLREWVQRPMSPAPRVNRWKCLSAQEVRNPPFHREGGRTEIAFTRVEGGASPPAACRSGHREQPRLAQVRSHGNRVAFRRSRLRRACTGVWGIRRGLPQEFGNACFLDFGFGCRGRRGRGGFGDGELDRDL